MNKISVIVLLCVYAARVLAADLSAWREADWIGFTKDGRRSDLAERMIFLKRLKEPASKRVYVSSLLRKPFRVDQPVRSASVQVCGLGLHELYLNGKKIGDRVLEPAPTTYDKLSLYSVYDVTANIKQGGNGIGLMLGNGFYGQDFGFYAPQLNYGAPRAKLVLTIEYTDGSSMQVATDESWRAAQSPILFDNLYGGETYDARMEQPGWSTAGFADADWHTVEIMDAPTDRVIEQRLEPMLKIRAVRPVAVTAAENGEWILDLGENMTGWIEARFNEPRGTVVEMRFAEHLMPGGKAIDTASTGVRATGCEQKDIYICKGGGERWEPRFTYHGFRYVQVKGLTQKPELGNFTGWFIRTGLERIGRFKCSDPLLNKFYDVSLRTIEGNLQGLLSDCPHRERCAWLGDMHATAETINMNYAAGSLWRKHIADFGTTLGASVLPKIHYPADDFPEAVDPRAPSNIACGRRLCGQARPDWGVAMILVPWYNWLYFGDRETAENSWEMMEDYMEFLHEGELRDNLIKKGYAYGDWAPPGGNPKMDTSPRLSASILYVRTLRAMAQMAKLLGKDGEARNYVERAGEVSEAINQRFFNADENHYGTQTATAMALSSGGVVPAGKESKIAAGLNRLIMEESGGNYTTGIMGHRYLYTVLNDNGYAATSAKLFANTGYPSLSYMTETLGLTTWPENNSFVEEGQRFNRHSYNHPMQSGFAVAFHESIGGIRPDPDHPGFERFILKPCFLPGLEWARADYESVRGKISSHWKRDGETVHWTVTVPESSVARVELPSGMVVNGKAIGSAGLELEAGEWTLDVSLIKPHGN